MTKDDDEDGLRVIKKIMKDENDPRGERRDLTGPY